ncbi:MAG: UDP-glucose 4-epimerase [Candidatus Rokuibacteriota bacterium]|nr:MAG: UDP-glucose 4-epimerase [Candidatus Rokubacteria bacterium]PYN08496.1 MAG: UDP-glucose 4-epimerase [Candidatus Rokubacteria bacterium]
MRALVTGGAGFIGSHVVDRLLAAGHAIDVVDNLSTGRRELAHPAARLHAVDIRSPRLRAVFAETRPDAVVHLAAQMDVRRSVADPLFDASVNVLGTLNVLECCRRAAVARLVFASSGGAIYGDCETVPTPESQPTRPASPYGVAKLAAERYIAAWAALTGSTAVALRYANVYGPRQNPLGEAGVVAIFSSRLVAGEPCLINGDGEQTRDYVYVEDVADATLLALGVPQTTDAINIGTGVESSVNDLYRRLAAVAGATPAARHGPGKPGEQRRSALDAGLAKRLLGWAPATPLDLGLRKTLEFIRGGASR